MLKTITLPLVAVAALAVAGVAAAADPSPHQIYEAVQSGQLVLAQQMITQVLQDQPESAKAHYIAAEVDAKVGDLNAARQQLAKARELDPKLSFESTRSVSELDAQLAGRRPAEAGAAQAFAPAAHSSSVPWGLIIVLAAGGLLLWSLFRRRQQAAYFQQPGQQAGGVLPPGGPGLQSGYGYGSPYPPPSGGMGSGLMGGLATGLAVGAGVAAGESLVHHMIDGRDSGGSSFGSPAADLRDPPANQDAGGVDFGTSDGSSWGNDASGGGDSFGGGDGGGDWS